MKENNKKPFYKKWWFWLLIAGSALILFFIVTAFIFIIFAVATGGESTSNNNENIQDNSEESENTNNSDENNESREEEAEPEGETIENEIENAINKIVEDDLKSTEIKEVRVNEDASTDEERYIILVDLRWDVKNKPDTTEEMIDMYSDHLAAKMADYDKIYEFVEFWEIPYHKENENIIKKTYENVDDGMMLQDEMKDPDIF